MRVGVDATSWGNRRGFGRFARNAVGRLVALDGETEYVLVVDAADKTPLPAGVTVRSVRLSRPPGEAASADGARSPADLARLSAAAARGRFDAMLFPSVYTYFPVPGCAEVVGIHDAIADQLPHLTLPSRRARTFWKAKERMAIHRAARVFTVSEASRTVLSERFGLRRDEIAIVPEAPDPVFTPRGAADIERALEPLGLEAGRFFLFAGGISPHKNVLALLDAYARLREVLENDVAGEGGAAGERGSSGESGSVRQPEAAGVPPLVLVGDLKDDPFLSIALDLRVRIADLELEEHVHLPGFVSDQALACLYSAATAVVLPSLIEGFGLPAVEAAGCGAPVLLSDLPSHRASLGDAALYFDPEDVQAIAAAMAWALEEPGRTLALAQGAREAVAGLTWDASARALREILAEAAGR